MTQDPHIVDISDRLRMRLWRFGVTLEGDTGRVDVLAEEIALLIVHLLDASRRLNGTGKEVVPWKRSFRP